jgi:hypothetical protein
VAPEHLRVDTSVREILIHLSVLCVFTGSQVSHSGLTSAELPSGDNTQPVIVITLRYFAFMNIEYCFTETDSLILVNPAQ